MLNVVARVILRLHRIHCSRLNKRIKSIIKVALRFKRENMIPSVRFSMMKFLETTL